jgi:RecB family endonuclease NucS
MKYEKVNVAERDLEELIRVHAGMIEEGLVYVDHQRQTAGGRLDVLMAA